MNTQLEHDLYDFICSDLVNYESRILLAAALAQNMYSDINKPARLTSSLKFQTILSCIHFMYTV